jgi:hypothetical protein
MIRASMYVAVADWPVTADQSQLFHDIGTTLGMSRAHVQAVVAEMAAEAPLERLQSAS